jgi:DNA-binding MarR family transcriptional regulator
MTIDDAVQLIQRAYPQIYLACHTRHHRRRSSAHRLSARDATILVHLDDVQPITPLELSRHLGIARSTLSEALKRLIALGYAQPAPPSRGATARVRSVLLTPQGARAIQDTSVIESSRLRAALARLTGQERSRAVGGVRTLAAACRALDRHRSERESG